MAMIIAAACKHSSYRLSLTGVHYRGPATVQEAVQRTAMIIAAACNGLLDFLKETRDAAESSGNTLRAQLLISIGQMDTIDWLVPPMLSKRN